MTNEDVESSSNGNSSCSSSSSTSNSSLGVPSQHKTQHVACAGTSSSSSWSLQIRTVNAKEQEDFFVQVHPDENIDALYDKIKVQTGLTQEQQRLIYRGRLLAGQSEKKGSSKIRDITGLSDGHCIHLVKRKETTASEINSTVTARTESSSSVGSSLLSTILGLGSTSSPSPSAVVSTNSNNNDGNSTGENTNNSSSTTSPSSARRWRRFGRRGRAHYRLTADDIEVPDPGSMESVRQGLLTLHTLLPASSNSNPLETNRQWYRGQWVDCRDTVNQWLEATVVDIVPPNDILPPRSAAASRTVHSCLNPVTDPAVHGDDLNGRYRLLLEPCPEGCPDEDEGGEWQGFRRRASNASAVLLLIHYNGWPHRWDEWIRSDSERLRPFRVRTRHPNASSHVSPTVQAPFADQPSTFIRGATEAEDRQHVLPEMMRVMHQVQSLMEQAAGPEAAAAAITPGLNHYETRQRLPWRRRMQDPPEDVVDDNDTVESSVAQGSYTDQPVDHMSQEVPTSREQQRALQTLAPLLDRLGRTLVDAAPHVAALAAARAEEAAAPGQSLDTIDEHPSSLGGLLSMLSRDRRRNSIASSQAVASLSTTTEPQTVTGDQATVTSHTVDANSEVSIDPDYTDFAAGLVNTTRGEVRTGPRSRSSAGSDDLSSLLGAYLAAASLASGDGGDDSNLQLLGRILRDRDGGGGGGIDIHIHAVVTAPGVLADGETGTGGGGGGGLGALLAGLGGGGGGITTATNDNNTIANNTAATTLADDLESLLPTARRVPSVLQQEEDDLGIFSDLYSESPEPAAVEPSRTPTTIPTSVVSPSSSPARPAPTSPQRRSPRHTATSTTLSTPSNHSSLHSHNSSSGSSSIHNNNHNSNSSNHNQSSQTSSPTQRRQGFLGRFLRRNQSSE